MQPVIYEPFKEAKRIKVFIPYDFIIVRESLKKWIAVFGIHIKNYGRL
jgi:hypothetical protein